MEAYHLHNAIKKNDMATVRTMISDGADIHYQFNGRNALHVACESESPKMVQFLLNAGADVNACRDKGEGITTLQHAIRKYRVPLETVKLLLEHGAEVNTRGPQGYSPLDEAVMRSGELDSSLSIARLLIQHGAKLNPDKKAQSATLTAALHQRPDMLKLFLEKGADPNVHNEEGKYPIHYAVYNKDVQSVQLLKEHGAELNVKDPAGKTALDYAKDKAEMMSLDPQSKKKYQKIVELLSP